MDLFKKRFMEQRRQTKMNQSEMAVLQSQQLKLGEQSNYLEKEI